MMYFHNDAIKKKILLTVGDFLRIPCNHFPPICPLQHLGANCRWHEVLVHSLIFVLVCSRFFSVAFFPIAVLFIDES